MDKQRCERCQQLKASTYRRPEMGGRTLCSGCYYLSLRARSPTGLVRRLEALPTWMREE